jgi:hypothetical protein
MLSAIISLVWSENRIPVTVRPQIARVFIRLTFATHRNSVGDSNGVVLPSKHALLLDCIFDRFSQVEHWKNSTGLRITPIIIALNQINLQWTMVILTMHAVISVSE